MTANGRIIEASCDSHHTEMTDPRRIVEQIADANGLFSFLILLDTHV
jgi:hypothetical protein